MYDGIQNARSSTKYEIMQVLLTFTGFRAPYFKGLVDEEEQPGPILSLLSTQCFVQIFLFSTPSASVETEDAKSAISKLCPQRSIDIVHLHISDPTNYLKIFFGLRKSLQHMVEKFAFAQYLVAEIANNARDLSFNRNKCLDCK